MTPHLSPIPPGKKETISTDGVGVSVLMPLSYNHPHSATDSRNASGTTTPLLIFFIFFLWEHTALGDLLLFILFLCIHSRLRI